MVFHPPLIFSPQPYLFLPFNNKIIIWRVTMDLQICWATMAFLLLFFNFFFYRVSISTMAILLNAQKANLWEQDFWAWLPHYHFYSVRAKKLPKYFILVIKLVSLNSHVLPQNSKSISASFNRFVLYQPIYKYPPLPFFSLIFFFLSSFFFYPSFSLLL